MNLDRWTTKSQEALQAAQRLAEDRGHQELSEEHLLKALLEADGGVASEVVKQAGADPAVILKALDKEISRRPQVSGGQLYPSSGLSKALRNAEERMKAMKDEYLSVEHLL